jgi:GT2 family glycosyltransferase
VVFSHELIDYVINIVNRNRRAVLGIVNNDKLFGNYVITRFVALHKELFKKIGGFDENIGYMGEDVEFSIRAKMLGAVIIPINSHKIIHVNDFVSKINMLKYFLNQIHWTYIIIKYGKYFRLRSVTFFIKSNILRVLLRIISFYFIIILKIRSRLCKS